MRGRAVSAVPEHLRVAENELGEAFEHLHRRNDNTRQADPHLREAVSACSAALAAVRRAVEHAEQVYETEATR